MSLAVERAGPSTLVQDAGRPGLADLGVGPAGAFDRRALRASHAILGNDSGAAVLETFGHLVLRATTAHVIALTGATAELLVAGVPTAHGRAVHVPAGAAVEVRPPGWGVRCTLGVAGGIVVPEVLGSASTDTLSGLGPPRVADGDRLAVGPSFRLPVLDDVVPVTRTGDVEVALVLGPRDDWFTPAAVATLLSSAWTVSDRSDRIGVRLDGPGLERAVTGELASEPVIRGSVQVTSAGLPVVLGPDHPVTGGYPVIGVVRDADTDALAQLAPGAVLRFRRALPKGGGFSTSPVREVPTPPSRTPEGWNAHRVGKVELPPPGGVRRRRR